MNVTVVSKPVAKDFSRFFTTRSFGGIKSPGRNYRSGTARKPSAVIA
jgi:hypothetical protein